MRKVNAVARNSRNLNKLRIVAMTENWPEIVFTAAEEVRAAHKELSVTSLHYHCEMDENEETREPVILGSLTMLVKGEIEARVDAAKAINNGRLDDGNPKRKLDLKRQLLIHEQMISASYQWGIFLETFDVPGIIFAISRGLDSGFSWFESVNARSKKSSFELNAQILSPNMATANETFRQLSQICKDNGYRPLQLTGAFERRMAA